MTKKVILRIKIFIGDFVNGDSHFGRNIGIDPGVGFQLLSFA